MEHISSVPKRSCTTAKNSRGVPCHTDDFARTRKSCDKIAGVTSILREYQSPITRCHGCLSPYSTPDRFKPHFVTWNSWRVKQLFQWNHAKVSRFALFRGIFDDGTCSFAHRHSYPSDKSKETFTLRANTRASVNGLWLLIIWCSGVMLGGGWNNAVVQDPI